MKSSSKEPALCVLLLGTPHFESLVSYLSPDIRYSHQQGPYVTSRLGRIQRQNERFIAQALKVAILRQQLNEHIPIARIPSEILAEISLAFVRQETARILQSEAGDAPGHTDTLAAPRCEWIRIAHISHRWRESALASPRIWSTILLSDSTQHAREMLARAKASPLDIWDHGRSTRSARLAVLERLSQIRHLDIRIASLDLGNFTFPGEAPLLESLSISQDHQPHNAASKCFFAALGQCKMSLLRHLSFHCIEFNLALMAPFFAPSLRELNLRKTSLPGGWFETARLKKALADVLNVLVSLPLLERLQLEDLLENAPTDQSMSLSTINDTVPLQRLSSLRLSDRPWACLLFMRLLQVSPQVSLFMRIASDYASISRDRNLVLTTIAVHITQAVAQNAPPAVLLTAAYHLPPVTFHTPELRFVSWSTYIPTDKVTLVGRHEGTLAPLLDIRFQATSLFPATFHQLSTLLPLSRLQSLIVLPQTTRANPVVSESMWEECCGSMTDLRELHVARWGQQHLAGALFPKRTRRGGEERTIHRSGLPPSRILLPKLETLTLSELLWIVPEEMDSTSPATTFYAAFHARNKVGFTLRGLVIKDSFNIHESDIHPFRRIVNTVSWDGRARSLEEYDAIFNPWEDDERNWPETAADFEWFGGDSE